MALTAYRDWNRAIVDAVTASTENGFPVYLDIDEGRLELIGVSQLGIAPPDQALDGFLGAIRDTCIRQTRVDLTRILGDDTDGRPEGVAFLATLVLAAYDMGEDEQGAANNFFLRLRERLNLPTTESGRPAGLDPGFEVHLWRRWNQWLVSRGWVPTAYPGQGAVQYIQYARGQTLLRLADRQHLTQLYLEHKMVSRSRRWDGAQHLQWLSRQHGMTANLRAVLSSPDTDRRSALGTAVAELVEDLEVDSATTPARRRGKPRCGLYRVVHHLSGQPSYRAFIRMPRDVPFGGAQVVTASGRQALEPLKGLWTKPVSVQDLLSGQAELRVEGIAGVEEITVPERDHWTLVRDPDDPFHGDYATWRSPELGESFILLGRSQCGEQLDRLKAEGVLDWKDEPIEVADMEDWLEWRDCKILSPSWEHMVPVNPELFDDLRPARLAIGVRLVGGLPGPNRGSWMERHPPLVLSAVFGRCRMQVRPSSNDEPVHTQVLIGEQENNLPASLAPGDYLLEIFPDVEDSGADEATPLRVRTLRILGWDTLSTGQTDPSVATALPGAKIQGALILETAQEKDEGASQ
jgi:hypothetical protein